MLYGRNSGYRTDDGLGSVRLIVDEDGDAVASFSSNEFGVEEDSSGTRTDLNYMTYVGALGVRNDPSGLLYMRQRYYDSSLGRWLSADPIGFSGGLNLYTYVGQNPANLVDPSGLQPPNQVTTNNLDWPTATMTTVPPQGYRNDCDGPTPLEVAGYIAAAIIAYELAVGASLALPYLGYRAAAAGYARFGAGLTGGGFALGRFLSGTQNLFHGSIQDTGNIRQNGFQVRCRPTYVSPNLEAAENAIGANRTRFQPATDPGIIQMQVPNNLYNRNLKPLAEPYAGWSGTSRNMEEIPVTDPYHIHILNSGIQK